MACPSSVQPRDRYVPTPLVDVPRTCCKLMRFFAIANSQARRGMCVHEKAMVGMILLIIFGVAGHWLFHWF